MIDYEGAVLGILGATGPIPRNIILCTLQSVTRKPNLNADWSIAAALDRLIEKGYVVRKGAFYEKVGGDVEPCDLSRSRIAKTYCAVRDGASSRKDLIAQTGVDRDHIGDLLRRMQKCGYIRETERGWVIADD